ncbi:MAG: ATP-binding protein [Candidatus Gracilibacteria bacterium]|nr:ATP-binding protein [Candidatus Gracilibacteria bacterium]
MDVYKNLIIDTMELLNYNKHWNKDYYYNFKNTRLYFNDLVNNLDSKFINLLIGLRRVGKTTLMLQLINKLINGGMDRDSIFYYSFDDKNEISSIINDYLKISNKELNSDKLYIFFDEIQKVEDWQNKIKTYYDLYPNIKFILSGSSSVFLRSTESLAGRINITEIKPLFFEEYLDFKDKLYFLEKPKLYEQSLILEFEKYLYRQYYDTINLNLIEAKNYIKNLKNKIIKEDAKDYFDIKYPDLLLRLFDIIASSPGMTIDYHNLGNDLGVDPRTVQTYIYYLEESFLINKVYNYSPNLLTSEKKQKKIYIKSCSFYTGNGEISGELYENYIQNYFDFKYFFRFNNKEVDFIGVSESGDISGVEVKYKERIKKDDLKGLNFFEKKFKIDNKIIISKNNDTNLGDVKVLPFWKISNLKDINSGI